MDRVPDPGTQTGDLRDNPLIEDFLTELSSSAPVPGGGSVAALEAALGASLLAMVANLTIGRKRYADVEPDARRILARAEELRDRAVRLSGEDRDAYAAVSSALGLGRETDEQKRERRARIQDALKGAALPPLQTMEVAAEVLRLAGELVDIGNRSAISDVGSAALSAHAGLEAARLNVEINLASVDDETWREDIRRSMERLPDAGELKELVLARTRAVIAETGS